MAFFAQLIAVLSMWLELTVSVVITLCTQWLEVDVRVSVSILPIGSLLPLWKSIYSRHKGVGDRGERMPFGVFSGLCGNAGHWVKRELFSVYGFMRPNSQVRIFELSKMVQHKIRRAACRMQ